MSEPNPYRAPAAAVRDPQASGTPAPAQVRLACAIFWAVFVVSLVSLHPAIRGGWWSVAADPEVDADMEELAGAFVVLGILMTAVFSIIYAALVVLIGRRYAWARWAMLGFALFGSVVTALDFPEALAETPIAAALDVLMTLAEAWALYLVFFGSGAQWFRNADAA